MASTEGVSLVVPQITESVPGDEATSLIPDSTVKESIASTEDEELVVPQINEASTGKAITQNDDSDNESVPDDEETSLIDDVSVAFSSAVGENDPENVPLNDDDSDNSPRKNEVIAYEVPEGDWRNGLCSCFATLCCPTMVSLFCFPILLGQVIERMNYNIFGYPMTTRRKRNCGCFIYTALFVLVAAASTTSQVFIIMSSKDNPWVWSLLVVVNAWSAFLLIITCCVRTHMRKKFEIDSLCCCGDQVEDCCTSIFCTCCALIQMERHTHDHNDYPYKILSTTGLESDAPVIV